MHENSSKRSSMDCGGNCLFVVIAYVIVFCLCTFSYLHRFISTLLRKAVCC